MDGKTPVVKVVESCMVVPEAETPKKGIWLSNLDLVMPRCHLAAIYIYRHDGSRDFFSAAALKASLGRALVTFYPFAGRLRVDQDGRLEVACTGDGVLFVEAEAESTLDEFGDFMPSDVNLLLPPMADSGNPPLLLIQVTRFKCGGVCLGTAVHHTLADGRAALHFINSWSDLTRGGDVTVPPFLDRTLLRARHPPSVTVDLLELKQIAGGRTPSTARPEKSAIFPAILNLSRDQIATLKRSGGGGRSSLSRFTVVVAHVWRCACRARRLAPERESRLYLPADARGRLRPPLPPGFLGNAIIRTLAAAAAGEVASNPLEYGARKVQEATSRLDDDYVRSWVDFLETQEDVGRLACGSWAISASDLWVISWLGLPIHEADFGWGRPAFMGPASLPFGGMVYIVDAPGGDGGLAVMVSLEPENIVRFREMFYSDIADMERGATRGMTADGASVL